MNGTQGTFIIATALTAIGMWAMMPGGGMQRRMLGMLLGSMGGGLFASTVAPLGEAVQQISFWAIAAITVIAAAATITFRNPVYCAIWFALCLLGTSGLFLFQGSQFLAVATVVVYAGAILVTFLFVLMLAQPKGQAAYDRVSWEAMLSAAAGSVLVGILTMTLFGLFQSPEGGQALAVPPTTVLESEILAGDHVARLGAQLFSRHLISVEVAGVLLLVALIGAAVIVAQEKQRQEA